jgi:small subunit ribosomal protein S2
MREHIAVKEAQRLNIPVFAMVDTNCDPRDIDFVIPANDDAGKSIEIILSSVTAAISEGLTERKAEKLDASEGAVEEAELDETEIAEVEADLDSEEVTEEAEPSEGDDEAND